MNYVALDRLNGTRDHYNNGYTDAEEQKVDAYLQMQMQKIVIPNPDKAFLMETMLTMYANPLRNRMAAE